MGKKNCYAIMDRLRSTRKEIERERTSRRVLLTLTHLEHIESCWCWVGGKELSLTPETGKQQAALASVLLAMRDHMHSHPADFGLDPDAALPFVSAEKKFNKSIGTLTYAIKGPFGFTIKLNVGTPSNCKVRRVEEEYTVPAVPAVAEHQDTRVRYEIDNPEECFGRDPAGA